MDIEEKNERCSGIGSPGSPRLSLAVINFVLICFNPRRPAVLPCLLDPADLCVCVREGECALARVTFFRSVACRYLGVLGPWLPIKDELLNLQPRGRVHRPVNQTE